MNLVVVLICVLLFWSAPALADPITGALAAGLVTSLGVSAGIAATISGVIVTGALSIGLNFLSNALMSKPATDAATQTPSGVQTQLQIGAAAPRVAILGKQWTAGNLTYWNLYGDNNGILQLVFALAAGPHDLFAATANGAAVTLGGLVEAPGYRLPEYDHDGHGCAWVAFHNGFYDQAADDALVANASPPGRWPSTNRGRGICYAVVTLFYVPEMFPQGIPQFKFQIGARLYDLRADSTAGGVGAQRWNDQHTWAWSENVSVGAYLFERGLYINGVKQLGRGLAPVDILSDHFIAAANVCDEVVTKKDLSTEPRYRIGMIVGADRAYSQVEQDYCTAMGGALLESAGAYGPIAGTAQPVAFTFSTKNLIVGKPRSFAQKRSRSEIYNTLYGTWGDPDQSGHAVPFPPRRSSADVAEDKEELAIGRDYPFIPALGQVQRVGEIERRLGRAQATAGVTLGFPFSAAEQGDWCTWTDSPVGALTFQVEQYALDDANNITLTLRQISSDVYDFDPVVYELDPLNPGDLPGIGALISTVPDFSAEAVQLAGPGGLMHPGIRCLWSPILDRTVDRVRVQYRLAAQPDDVHDADPFPPEDGEGILSAGIQAAGAYEVRATIDTTPLRIVSWTAWTAVTAAALHVVPRSKVSDATLFVDPTALALEVRLFHRRMEDKISGIADFVGKLAGQVASQDFLGSVEASTQSVQRDDKLSVAVGAANASISTLSDTVADVDSAFGEFRTDLTTNFESSSAGGSIRTFAESTADTAVSEFDQQVIASTGHGLSASVQQTGAAVSTINGRMAAFYGLTVDAGHIASLQLASDGTFAAMRFRADAFVWSLNGYPDAGLSFGTVNGAPTIGAGANFLLDGILTARQVGANLLIADDANINQAQIKTIHVAGEQITSLRSAVGGDSDLTTLGLNTRRVLVTVTKGLSGGALALSGHVSFDFGSRPHQATLSLILDGTVVAARPCTIGIADAQPGSPGGQVQAALMGTLFVEFDSGPTGLFGGHTFQLAIATAGIPYAAGLQASGTPFVRAPTLRVLEGLR